ncbi:hypothetical protein AB1Y20_006747 [Prymnesium parvum]|uniref:Uncharacterized protein n=1 Tax=Prymnesium parvum TaxID=97485 RepID=A0AB34J1P0_PRYPA
MEHAASKWGAVRRPDLAMAKLDLLPHRAEGTGNFTMGWKRARTRKEINKKGDQEKGSQAFIMSWARVSLHGLSTHEASLLGLWNHEVSVHGLRNHQTSLPGS